MERDAAVHLVEPGDGPKTLSYGVVWTPVPYLNYLRGEGATPQQARRRGKIRPISVDRTEIGWLAARFPYPRQKSAGWLPDPDFYRNTSYCTAAAAARFEALDVCNGK